MEEQQNLGATPISFRCTTDLRESLERLATADQRSLANYVRKILEDHVRESTTTKSKDKAA